MIKKILLLSTICLITIIQVHAYKITLRTNDSIAGNFLLQNLESFKIDTISFDKKKVSLENNFKEMTPFIMVQMGTKNVMYLFVEPGFDNDFEIDFKNFRVAKVTGSFSQVEHTRLIQTQSIYQQTAQLLQQEYQKPNANQDSITNTLQFLNLQINNAFTDFITKNKDLNLASFLIFDIIQRNPNIPKVDIEKIFSLLSEKGKKTSFGKKLTMHLTRLNSMEIGNKIPDFALKDRNGKSYNIKSLRGKYVLIDFWASWCGPCKQEIPNLKNAYEKYKDKGFEIFSVSIDAKDESWKSALDNFKMPWIHVIDEHGPNAVTQTLFNVPTIPATLLIDKNGIIIGKDYRGIGLDNKLEELLK